MDVRSPFYQTIASALVGILFLNPIVATAAELAVDAAAGGNTRLGQAGNGVPIVNIATPNSAGLSHNKFSDYNVGPQGLILNNATGKTQGTQLGGIIIGNPNLQGQAAQRILNEVTGGGRSQLQGYTEVAGQGAHVIVANPHGITCNGCGFINTPRATLTTGKPILNGERLQGYDVDGGDIVLEGTGLNASNIDRFELITRSTKLNAELYAQQLDVVAGRNQVDAESLAATAKPENGSAKLQLAIDSSALGGMYAGAIRLVGTEAGVGVKLAGDLAASAGDIRIDANGRLEVAQVAASGNLALKGQDVALNGPAYAGGSATVQARGTLSNVQSLAASSAITLQANQLNNAGVIEAGVNADNRRNTQGDVTVSAQGVRNTGTVLASRTLQTNVNGLLDNQGGTLKGQRTVLTADTLDNRQGRLLAGNQLSLSALRLDNRNGQAVAAQLHVSGGGLDNRFGLFSAEQALSLDLVSLDNSGQGTLISDGTLQAKVSQQLDNHADGLLSAKGALGVQAAALDNRGGVLVSDAGLSLSGGTLNNSAQGVISGKGPVQLDLDQLDNSQGGTLNSDAGLRLHANQVNNANQGRIAAQGDLQAQLGSLAQQGGQLLAQGALDLAVDQLDNRNGGRLAANQGVSLKGGDLANQGGEISSRARVAISANSLDNGAGKIVGDAGLNMTVQHLANRAGTLAGRDGLSVIAQNLDNSQGGLLSSQKSIWLQLSGVLDNRGQGALLSQGTLNLSAASLDNRAGVVSSAGELFARLAGTLDNQGGRLLSDAGLDLAGGDLNNAGGVLSAAGDILLQTAKLDNREAGRIVSDAGIRLSSTQLDNHQGGSLFARDAIVGRVSGLDQHGGGQLISQTGIDLDLQGGALNNASAGLIATPGALLLRNVAQVDNRGGEISSDRAFSLATGTLLNQGGKILSADRLHVQGTAVNNSQGGVLSGSDNLELDATSLDNSQGGTLASRGDLRARVKGALDNHGDGALVAGGVLDVTSASLDNQGGLLSSSGDLTLTSGTSDNRYGKVIAQGRLAATTANLDNRGGVFSGQQGFSLRAGDVRNGINSVGQPGGLITSQGTLVLNTGQLEAIGGGEISAKGDLQLTVATLIQQQAQLIGEGNVRIDLGHAGQRGDFDNRSSVLTAGSLQINGLGNLDNRGGEISSARGFDLNAGGTLDNGDRGRLISAGQLSLDAVALRNANQGLVSGWQGLSVNAASLDNSASGTLSSRNGPLAVTLTGALDNHDQGALVSQGKLTLAAGGLNNAGGILSSQADLGLTLAGDLDNRDGGLLSAQGALTGVGAVLDNRGGQISANDVQLDANRLDNSGGSLSSQGRLRLGLLGALLNVGPNAQLASAGPLNISADSVDNRGGQLVSQGLLRVLAGRFDNSAGGTVASQDALDLTLSGALLNGQDGLLYSKGGTLDLSAASLDNAAGTLQGQSDTTLRVQGIVDNQGGRLTSQAGDLDLQSASLDNGSGGVLNSVSGWLKLVIGWFGNNRGVTQAQSLEVEATGGIDNRNGHLSAISGANQIVTTTLDNGSGGLYAGGLLSVSGDQLLNQGGKIGAGTLDFSLAGALNNQSGLIESTGALRIAAASLANRSGAIRALGQASRGVARSSNPSLMRVTTSGLLDNTGGRLESATDDFSLHSGSLQNAGGSVLHVGTGTFALDLAQAGLAGGSFTSNGSLSYQAASWTTNAVIQARHLTLNVGALTLGSGGQLLAAQSFTGSGDTWNNAGLIASDGSLDLSLTGRYTGAGLLSSLGNLSLGAGLIDLSTAASLASGGIATVSSRGAFDNHGRLTSAGALQVSAGTLSNFGTLGSAGTLHLTADDLLNQGGLLFSGGDMVLRVDNFTNRYADVYSLGSLDIAGDDAGKWSTKVENLSSTLESGSDLSIRASRIDNQRAVVAGTSELVSSAIGVRCATCVGVGDSGSSHLVWIQKYHAEVGSETSAASSIAAGRDLIITGGELMNSGSSLSAVRDGQFTLNSFTNQGLAFGDYTVRRSLEMPWAGSSWETATLWLEIFAYNATHDESYGDGLVDFAGNYRPSVHYWDRNYTEDAVLMSYRYGNSKNDPFAAYLTIGSIQKDLGDTVMDSFLENIPQPNYQAGNTSPAPDFLQNASFFDELTTYDSPTSFTPAVVQVGGQLAITATQELTNSVIREGATLSKGGDRTGDTQVGSHASTVVALNAQLPPDLAQQQVNPITLPGFSLPQGQNGLFRLSGQGGSGGSADRVQGAGDLNFAGQQLSQAQRERALDGAGGLAGDVALGAGVATGTAPGGAGLNVKRVQGLPSSATPNNSQKYLIETNPELTSLKSFLSSDYLLDQLGYDPDQAQKRLGDGLYEQRLLQQAVVARTGQRFLDGMASDEALFKYLMDNAIAYQDRLNLSIGVALTAEQVAALTHDIVWLQEQEVGGEKVLVPVLYLAQADGRLAPNGALIQGQDVSLISGGDLTNQGTLRASNSLNATATNLGNSGLIEAGNRLDLLATDSIRNAQGGIIAGRDVSLTALTGDVINQRTVTEHQVDYRNTSSTEAFVDSAARIEAADTLTITAGRDVVNAGSTLRSGGDLSIQAGRDVGVIAVEQNQGWTAGTHAYDTRTTQLAAEVTAGRDLSIGAGRDLAAVASRLDAARDAALSAGRDVALVSGANEQHSYQQTKKVTAQQDHVRQQSTTLTAGGDLTVSAGQDLTLKSSKISAGNEAYLVAGDKLEVLAANDSDYTLYQKTKKGSFGSESFKRDEVTDVQAVGSEISAGGDITLLSGGDQKYQVAKLDSGNDLAIVSGGSVTFEAVKDLYQESHEKSDSDLAWSSAKGKGSTDETLHQSQLIAQGSLAIKAVDGLKIDLKQIDQKSVSQTIDAMVQADPNLAWLKEAEARGDVDWRRVQEVHDSFKYSSSGMGIGLQLAVAIAAAAMGGMAAAGSLSSAGVAGGSFAMGAGVGAAGSLASTAAVSLINSKGDLGQVLQDSLSSDSLKQLAIASLTGGLTAEYFNSWSGADTNTRVVGGKTIANLNTWEGIGSFAANQGMQNLTSAALSKALDQGGSFGDALKNSFYNTFAAAGFNQVGNVGAPAGSPANIGLHALMGGLASVVSGGDFVTGAAAAGANEALVASLDRTFSNLSPDAREQLLTTSSQLIGLLAVAVSNQDAGSNELQTGAWVAQNSTQYNHELHRANAKSFVDGALDYCKQKPDACSPGAGQVTQQDMIAALEATAAHGEGIDKVKPEALQLVNQFLTNPDLAETLKADLFSPTASEQQRLAINDTAELALAGLSLAQAAKAVLMGGGKTLAKIAAGLRKESDGGAKEIVKVNPPLALPPGKQGSVIRGSLTDHEFKQASEIVSFKGGEFKGVDSSKFAGIDGWLDGVPVQLKVVEGTSINAVRRNIVSGAKDMAKAGYRGDIYIDASRTGVSMNKMLDHFKPGSPVSNVVGEGVVSNVYIKTQDGWVNISAGRVAQHKGWQ